MNEYFIITIGDDNVSPISTCLWLRKFYISPKEVNISKFVLSKQIIFVVMQ